MQKVWLGGYVQQYTGKGLEASLTSNLSIGNYGGGSFDFVSFHVESVVPLGLVGQGRLTLGTIAKNANNKKEKMPKTPKY